MAMFDWDRDYEEVTAGATLVVPSGFGAVETRGILSRLLAPLAVVVALGAVAMGTVALQGSTGPSLMSVAGLTAWLRPSVEMPDTLQAYGDTEFANFRRGIMGFSDNDLFTYVEGLEHQLRVVSVDMAVFARDSLTLAYQEIDRRGLIRPVATLRVASRTL